MIYAIYNGWVGNGAVAVIVKANNKTIAADTAKEVLAKDPPAISYEQMDSWLEITEIVELELPIICELELNE